MMTGWLVVWLGALLLNFAWENWHSVYYQHYQGRPITKLVLLKAALVDSILLLVIIGVTNLFIQKGRGILVVFLIGVIVAVGLEKWALERQRWAYKATMRILPFLKTGLTPTLQLGVTGAVIYGLTFWLRV